MKHCTPCSGKVRTAPRLKLAAWLKYLVAVSHADAPADLIARAFMRFHDLDIHDPCIVDLLAKDDVCTSMSAVDSDVSSRELPFVRRAVRTEDQHDQS